MPPKKRSVSEVIAATCEGMQLRSPSKRKTTVTHSPPEPAANKGRKNNQTAPAGVPNTYGDHPPKSDPKPTKIGTKPPPPKPDPPKTRQTKQLPKPDPPKTRSAKTLHPPEPQATTLTPTETTRSKTNTQQPPPPKRTIQMQLLRRSPRCSIPLRVEKPLPRVPRAPVFTSDSETGGDVQAMGKEMPPATKYPTRTVMRASSRSRNSSAAPNGNQDESEHEVEGERVVEGGEEILSDVADRDYVLRERHEEIADEDEGVEEEQNAVEEVEEQEEEPVVDEEEQHVEEEANVVDGNEAAAANEENAAPPVVLSIRCKSRPGNYLLISL